MTKTAAPVQSNERIASMDVLRGTAVLGILLMNIQAFAMPGAAYINATAYGDLTGVNWWVWALSHVFADQKFMAIFSMLFGAGVCLFTDRAMARSGRSAGLHYRRTLWLLLFGLIHAHLFWYGDILVTYAVSALIVYPFRNRAPRTLVIWAAVLLALPPGYSILMGLNIDKLPPEVLEQLRESWSPDMSAIAEDLAIYRGSWLDQQPHRSATATFFETLLLLTNFMWRASGMMLIGMALYRSRVLSAERSSAFYVKMLGIGATVGLPLVLFGAYRNTAADFALEYSMFLGVQWNYCGSIGLSLAYVALVMLVVQRGIIKAVQRRLAATGRMAFTNYLLQTLICTLLFYGHGLGWYGSVERWQQALVVLCIWSALRLGSPLWLARFRFGPMEWLWRSLTYWRRQPMR